MTESIIIKCPSIPIRFDPNLLSMQIWIYDAEKLKQIGDWLIKKIDDAEFRKHPNTVKLLFIKYQQFMELYERAKAKERDNKEKTCLKTHWPFYRPKLANRDDQRLFERLEHRRKTSIYDRKNNAV